MKAKARTETVSFRLGSTLRGTLEEEAEKAGTSFNSLISQILFRYTSWGRYADRLKLIPVSKDLLRDLFQTMENEGIRENAQSLAETAGSEHILFLFQKINLDTVLRFIDLWRSHFDASQHRYDGKTHFYTLHHDVNRKFSLFIKEYLSSLIQRTVPREIRFETVSPNAVTFSFEG